MKVLSILLAITASASAASGDPGNAALRFLEKVRSHTISLEPGTDTALSPQTSEPKRKEISRRLDKMAHDLGKDTLELSSVKLDGEYAAALIRKSGGYDPNRMQVFPIALVKRAAGWIAAPVPASFENAGVGYTQGLRKRLDTLEQWMLEQRVADLEMLHQQAEARMRSSISEKLPAQELLKLDSQSVTTRFLNACSQHRLLEMLGLLGGLSERLPDDWSQRLSIASAAANDVTPPSRAWKLLMAPQVLRVPVNHEEDGDSALATIACLDPAGHPQMSDTPKVELVHFGLSKTQEGFWQINPPRAFYPESSHDDEDDEDLDADLLDMFPAQLAQKYPPNPQPTAQKAKDALLAALATSKPDLWPQVIHTQSDPKECRKLLARAASIWWNAQNPANIRMVVPMDFHETNDHAVMACQFFDTRVVDSLNLQFLYFDKTPTGWLWQPSPTDETLAQFHEWLEPLNAGFQNGWQEALLRNCPKVGAISSPAPSEADARKVVEEWIQNSHPRNLLDMLQLTARTDKPSSTESFLRRLGHEITGARINEHPTKIISVHHGEFITTVGVQSDPAGKQSHPLYPVISTADGPRILLEVDLIASAVRRDFLNRTTLEELGTTSPPAADELKKQFEDFQRSVETPATP